MGWVRLFVVIGIAGFAAHWWKGNHAAHGPANEARGPGGFVQVAMPDGAAKNAVVILAPLNCPEEGARRADDLADKLSRRGITVVRSASYSTNITNPTDAQKADLDRAVQVLNGEVPAVFVNGMGKSNPSAEEVALAYQPAQ